MNLNLYKQASDLEECNQEEALGIYNKLEHENKEFNKSILLAWIFCPIFASIISFIVVQSVSSHQTITTLLILSVLGYFPPILMYLMKLDGKERAYIGTKTSRLSTLAGALIGGIIMIVGNIIELVIMAIYGVILALVIEIPIMIIIHFLTGVPFFEALPIPVIGTIGAVCFIIIFLVHMSEVALTPGYGYNPLLYLFGMTLEFIFSAESSRLDLIKEVLGDILAGLKVHSRSILEYAVIIAVVFVLGGSGSIGIIYEDIYKGIIASCFAGLLLGLAYARDLEKDYILGNLYRIAIIRCLVRLDRRSQATHRLKDLKWIFTRVEFSHPDVIEDIVSAMEYLIDGGQKWAKESLNEAVESVNSPRLRTFGRLIENSGPAHFEVKYREIILNTIQREIILDSIQKTMQLASQR
jgi:hypothetical protein